MAEDTKIVHVEIVDGTPEQVKALRDNLQRVKEKLNFEAEFIITNGVVKFRDAKYLIEEIYKLMKREKVEKKQEK